MSLSYGLCKFPLGYLRFKNAEMNFKSHLRQFEQNETDYKMSLKRMAVLSAVS